MENSRELGICGRRYPHLPDTAVSGVYHSPRSPIYHPPDLGGISTVDNFVDNFHKSI